jgi:hypothetical protein
VTESEQRRLFALVSAAFEAKGTPEFEQRIEAIVAQWRERYEYALIRRRDRQWSSDD